MAGDPTGAQVAAALGRLSEANGSVVSVGRDDLVTATTIMGNGGSLLVDGASGRMSFDSMTGDPQNADIWRWDLSWQDMGSPGYQFEDCGTAVSFSAENPLGQPDWCAALCMTPPPGKGDDACKPDGLPMSFPE